MSLENFGWLTLGICIQFPMFALCWMLLTDIEKIIVKTTLNAGIIRVLENVYKKLLYFPHGEPVPYRGGLVTMKVEMDRIKPALDRVAKVMQEMSVALRKTMGGEEMYFGKTWSDMLDKRWDGVSYKKDICDKDLRDFMMQGPNAEFQPDDVLSEAIRSRATPFEGTRTGRYMATTPNYPNEPRNWKGEPLRSKWLNADLERLELRVMGMCPHKLYDSCPNKHLVLAAALNENDFDLAAKLLIEGFENDKQ